MNKVELKNKLQDLKKVKVSGMRFTIRKISPLLDFPLDKMPQIFTDFMSRRKVDKNAVLSPAELLKSQQDIYSIIQAGVVDPKLEPIGIGEKRGKENGITVEDLFRDPDIGYGLYNEIMTHSLLRFRGLKSVFFSIKIKYLAFMESRKNMEKAPAK